MSASRPCSSICRWSACPPSRSNPSRLRSSTRIQAAAVATGVELAAISGTFNAAHPDPAQRQQFLDRFGFLCTAAAQLGIPVITLSSGSRDPDDMWRWHPDNATGRAWVDSRATLQALVAIAEPVGVRLAFEPEHSNVVTTAAQAVTMIGEVGSPLLGVVYDAANLLDPDDYQPAAAERAITTTSPRWPSRSCSATPRSSPPDGLPSPPAPACCPGR